ncbi:MAG: hypothetical protein JNK45_01945, partial [Myxococcales bacterium]|nr:hypothetical protein [Myxococcales bacterium]
MVGLLPLVAASLSLAAPPASPTPTRRSAPVTRGVASETRPYEGTLEATMPDAT